jgi:hypothetical protein
MVFACRTEEDHELSEQTMNGRDSSCVHPGYKPRVLLPTTLLRKMFYFSRKAIRVQFIQIFISQNIVKEIKQ